MNTRHSMDEAKRIQKAFEERFAGDDCVVGIGIGLNSSQDDLAITVYVTRREERQKLPARFDGLEVVVDVVDEFKAL